MACFESIRVRNMVSMAKGGRPVLDLGQCGSTTPTSTSHGTTLFICSRNSRLRVFLVDRFNPRLTCFMSLRHVST